MVKVNQYFKNVIYSDTYIEQKEHMDLSEVEKLEQAIQVHGYRGPSKKKHNGVVPIRPDDKELWKSLRKFKKLEFELLKNVDSSNIHFADVKAVAHISNGNRSIGSIYKNNKGELELYMLGFSNYNYQLF